MALTTDQIHAAADALLERGEKTTLAAVRREVGGGSFTTISEAMASWRERQQKTHTLADADIPAAVRERLEAAVGALWEAATTEAERRLASERDALEQAREQAAADVQEAKEVVATLEDEAATREARMERLEADLNTARAEAQTAKDAAAEADAARREALVRAEAAEAETARQRETAERAHEGWRQAEVNAASATLARSDVQRNVVEKGEDIEIRAVVEGFKHHDEEA